MALGVKEGLKTTRRLVSPVTLGRFDSVFGTLYQLIDQDYVGDINIVLKQSEFESRYTMFNFKNDEEIQSLITAGRRAAWPKIDQIKNSLQISSVIDEVLERLEQEAVVKPHKQRKSHITI